jgi:putative transposase
MANSYSQLNIHCVFAVKGRQNIITSDFRDELHRYMAGILKNDGAFPLAVGGWLDHVHVFFELPVTMSISDQMRMLKASSSKWINDNRKVKGRFSWQRGFGAFSYARSQRDIVIRYILNQEQHHQKKSFRQEYLDWLNEYEVVYDERYVFQFID